MSNLIHPTAVIDPTAQVGPQVAIGPYSVIGASVEIGEGTEIGPQVVIEANTIIGKNCKIASGAVIGGAPQDLGYKGEATRVRIGDGTHIRECVTINRATGEGKETVIGNDCMLMAYSHVAHNCQLGNNVITANSVQMGGYVELGDYVFLGGCAVVHQFCKIGRMTILGGCSGVRSDAPPFLMIDGRVGAVRGINTIGLRRRGFTAEQRQRLKKAVFYLWFSGLNISQAVETIHANLEVDEYVQELLDFIKDSKRGTVSGPARVKRTAHQTGEDVEAVAEPVGEPQ